MTLLFHGTTLWRARRIMESGPDADFMEPGSKGPARSFSACLPFGPFGCTGKPEDYAWGKSLAADREGRDEGGPALLLMDVPDGIMELAVDEFLPLAQGFVQFDPGAGLEELRAAWPRLEKRVIAFMESRS